jgi:hypothetical protein
MRNAFALACKMGRVREAGEAKPSPTRGRRRTTERWTDDEVRRSSSAFTRGERTRTRSH